MMNPFMDPSKMDPKLLVELTQIVRQLPPEQISRMQSLMHNMMAGIDVRREMEEFEKSLPPGFREKLVAIMGPSMPEPPSGMTQVETSSAPLELDERGARLTILRAVAEGKLSPEEAEKALFND